MQKLKYLRYEYHRTVSDLNAKGLVYAEVLGKEQEQLEGELHKEFSSILVDMQELDTENLVKELEEVCSTHLIILMTKYVDLIYPFNWIYIYCSVAILTET